MSPQSCAQRSANSIIDYADMRRRAETVFRESVQRARGPEVVAAVILSVVNSRSPLLRYRIGTEAVWLPRVKAMMPQKGFEIGVRKMFQLDG